MTGCAGPALRPLDAVERGIAEQTIEVWRTIVGLDLEPGCAAYALDVPIAVVPDSEYDCPENSWACYRDTPYYMVRDSVEDEHVPLVIAHEVTHALADCQSGDSDHDHARPELWGPSGVVRWTVALRPGNDN